MRWKNVKLVFSKELTDTLRDRRTLISSILIPILMVPLLFLGISVLAFFVVRSAVRENPYVMLIGREHAPSLAEQFEAVREIELVPAQADYVKQINDRKLRAAIEFPPDMEKNLRENPGQPQEMKIYYYEGELRSERIVRRLESATSEFNNEYLKDRLKERRLGEEAAAPFTTKRENVAPPERVTGNIVGMLLPYFLVLLSLTGAMYPAIDLTAGEKERGTMETILASPVGRGELVMGKFLNVVLVSMTSTALTIFSFALTVLGGAHLLRSVTEKLVLAVGVKSMAAVFFLILPLAVLFSAAMLAIAVYARSYREAQGYLGPLFMVVILPAVASMIPGIEINAKLALVPVLNVALITREVFAGQYRWEYIGMIFGATSALAAAALYLAARQFRRESVLFRQ
jgi:sodium transport system permease protein